MRNSNALKLVALVLMGYAFGPGESYAWFNDPTLNSPIAPSPMSQIEHAAIADGTGGAIVVWSQYVEGSSGEFDIYAQKIDAHGEPVWPAPTPVCLAPDFQGSSRIVSDQTGGAIVTWHDLREGSGDVDIYAQHISADGQTLWETNGLAIASLQGWKTYPDIAPDGLGGAVIVWMDGRNNASQLYAQRIAGDGQIAWQPEGVPVVDAAGGQADPEIISDGLGGTIVVWTDHRPINSTNIFAQSLDSDGNPRWNSTGLAVCRKVGNQFDAHALSDGIGGAFFCWTDARAGDEDPDIYIQRVSAEGNLVWGTQGGVPVIMEIGFHTNSTMVSDGGGGVIIAWEDGRKESEDTDIYAQRMTSGGVPAWNAKGVAVAATNEIQARPVLLADGASGAYVTWEDYYREGTWWNIFAQHLDYTGQAGWKEAGVAVCVANDPQVKPAIVRDGAGGSIIIWQDGRSGNSYNLYAQQLDFRGLLGGGEFKFYTADRKGIPRTSFPPGELIRFTAIWTMSAANLPGTYNAEAGMTIHSDTDFREEVITYSVEEP